MDLKDAAKALSDTLAAANQPGHFESLDDEEIDDIFEELRENGLEPSRALRLYFKTCDPLRVEVGPWIYDTLVFHPIRELPYVHDDVAWNHKGRLESWRGRWVIIASASKDPYFVDASRPALPVYMDTAATGALRPRLVSSSLIGFFGICVKFMQTFGLEGVHPNPGVPKAREDYMGEEQSKEAWESFMAWLTKVDPRAAESDFWIEAVD